MPVDNDKPRLPPRSSPTAKSGETPSAPPREEPHKVGRKQVSFSSQDSVATYVKGEGLEGHAAPQSKAAKAPAPSAPPRAGDAGCKTITRPNGSLRVLWPSGQRYDGPLDGYGAPHGVGTVTLSHGPVLHDARWSHGVCVAVGDRKAPAREVEAYRSPPGRRKPEQVRAPVPQGAGPVPEPGRGGKILAQLRKLTKPRDKGQP